MKKQLPFDDHVAEYEEWYDQYPWVFKSEVEALREMLPIGEKLNGIEIGTGTGRFSEALGIKEGIEPSENMRARAIKRGIEMMDAVAERLPYGDHRFDFVLMNFCISYFDDLHLAFKEAHRVTKSNGVLVVGLIDKQSIIGRYYDEHKPESTFYKQANFFDVEKILQELSKARFKHHVVCQTLFNPLEDIKEIQTAKPGYGEGSFVVIKAMKQPERNE